MKKWIECNALFVDDELENMVVNQEVWETMCIDLNEVIAFSTSDKLGGRATQVYILGTLEVIIDVPYNELRQKLLE